MGLTVTKDGCMRASNLTRSSVCCDSDTTVEGFGDSGGDVAPFRGEEPIVPCRVW
jgi:hypothetical protein